jgi:hypothetical protein
MSVSSDIIAPERLDSFFQRLLKKNSRVAAYYILLATSAVLGVVIIAISTRLGAGLSDDSLYYIKPARDFFSTGVLNLNPAFPPLLPVLLSILGLTGLDPLMGIRFLNAILFGASIFLSGLLLYRFTRSFPFSMFGVLLVLTAGQLIDIHSWALSEPLYILLFLLSLFLLDKYWQSERKYWLFAAGVILGLALITRYAGITAAAAGIIAILLKIKETIRQKFSDLVIFILLVIMPSFLYLARNFFSGGSIFGERYLNWEPFTRELLSSALYNILTWFVPGRLVSGREILLAGGLSIVFTLTIIILISLGGLKNWKKSFSRSPLLTLLVLFIIFNFIMLFASRGVFGRGDAFNNRYLSPIYLAVLLSLTMALWWSWKRARLIPKFFLGIIMVGLMATSFYRAVDTIRTLSENGSGYASARWHISETIAFINSRPDVEIVSTANTGIYFWTGRLPESIASFADPNDLSAYLRETGGYLVIIDSMPPEMYGHREAELVQGLSLLYRFSEGAVYEHPE